ncbi:methyl-accepting chemotaxis protein [Phaeospirillum tilakii]|uniref:Methyl-accepting chemotaxis protein n=1 Tax=Phaeospirillum tilakii TaxID=741673 RepID=A0ABW5CA18_9PROT
MSIKRFISVCLTAISAVVVALAIALFSDNWKSFSYARDAGELVQVLGALTQVSEALSPERGATSVALDGDPANRKTLDEARAGVDRAFDAALAQARGTTQPDILAMTRALEQIRADNVRLRAEADALAGGPSDQIAAFRPRFFNAMFEVLNRTSALTATLERRLVGLDADVASPAALAGTAWALRDQAGRFSTQHIAAITSGKPFSPELLRDLYLGRGRVAQLWEQLRDKAGGPDSPAGLREALGKLEAGFFTPFQPLSDRVFKAGLGDGVYDLTPAEWRRQTAPMLKSLMLMRDAAIAEAGQVAATHRDQALRALLLLGLLLAVAVVVLAGAVIGIQRRVVTPLSGLTGTIGAFAAGQRAFTVPHADRDDEIGQMAKAIEVLRANACDADDHARQEAADATARDQRRSQVEAVTARFVTSINTVVEGVSVAIEGLRRATTTLSATSATTTEQSGVVANAADHASSNVQTVAAAAEELSNSIQEISRRVAETAHAMDGAVHQAQATDATVRGLAEAARRIGDVVSLITDIASQTNLLALNATIEAARAGEAGKGFAVVAGEVKSLANQTAKATDDIQAQVAAIQAETERAVEAIGGISATIATVNQYTIGIASAVEQQGAATQEIARNVQQAAAGTAEVSHSIGRVLEAERATATAATELSALADRLHGESDRLKSEVGGFVAEVKAN